MSRSYKAPWSTDYSKAKAYYKSLASRKIRRVPIAENISDGKSYRKYFNPYDICDYKFMYDPHPKVYCFYGKLEWHEPDPIYKYNRK